MEGTPIKINVINPEQSGGDKEERDHSARHLAREVLQYDETRQRAPEAQQLHGSAPAQERIGHVVVSAESKKHQEETIESPGKKVQLPPNGYHRVENWSRAELFAASEAIAVEGTTLRKIYETHLIGERALRRLVAEHLLGGDLVRALQREIVEHEIDFERDPALRDMVLQQGEDDGADAKVTEPSKGALEEMVKKAEANIAADDEGLSYESAPRESPIPAPSSARRLRTLDITMMITIAVLAILVIALYFWYK